MDIILIRHGQTYNNIKKIYGGDETELTEEGREELRLTKKRLETLDYKKVYYSPLLRARQSLEILGLDGIETDELVEYNFGIFSGYSYKEIIKKYPNETKNWIEDPFTYKIPKGDSIEELYARVENFLSELIERDESVVLVSHAGIIQLVLSWVFDDYKNIYRFKVDNGSISIITVEADYKYISKLNW